MVIAVSALFMGTWMANQRYQALEKEWKRREQEYQSRAAMYAKSEISHVADAGTGKSNLGFVGDGTGYREIRMGPNEHKRLAAEAGRMKRKYEKAAESPWLSVESPLEGLEYRRIADEQGAVPTPEPPSWFHNPPFASAAPSKAAVSTGQ
jgi:hypothetical protein